MTKRIVGLFLALCLVVGLLPMIALAEESTTPPPATLAVATGTKDAPVEWKPELSEGMAPAYAKTVNGLIVTDGASETDYNLKVEWAIGGDPTLTMKNATINNDNDYPNKKNTIQIGGTEDFVIQLEGTNTINGRPASTDANLDAYRCPIGIYADNAGTLTIRGTSKATDALLINNRGGHGIDKRYNALTIENVKFAYTLLDVTGSSANARKHHGIALQYMTDGLEDKTNLTVRNADFTIDLGTQQKHYSCLAIVLCKSGDAASANNTGDILFQNSTVKIDRRNSTGTNNPIVAYGADSNFTIDRCDVSGYGWRYFTSYVPTILNYTTATYDNRDTNPVDDDVAYDSAVAETKININDLKVTHACGTAIPDDKDCTTASTCDMCGNALGTAQTAHTPAADDKDCTTAVMCANAGCEQIAVAAKTHEAAADDGNCTTAVLCKNAGCEHVMTPAATSHTSPAGRTCDQAGNCTVCGTLIPAGTHTGGEATCKDKAVCVVCSQPYGELADHKGGEATCKDKAVCTVCNQAYGELAAHKGGEATCKDKAVCTVCNQAYGELAAHTGGTATCKDKAVCTVCNQAYGELSKTHTPAADDGDCTTAIKCTVCGAETTAAAKEHKFTNDKDTSCDNAGCKHTRTIKNPDTGDVSILLTAAVALSSAVGFAGVTVLRKKRG